MRRGRGLAAAAAGWLADLRTPQASGTKRLTGGIGATAHPTSACRQPLPYYHTTAGPPAQAAVQRTVSLEWPFATGSPAANAVATTMCAYCCRLAGSETGSPACRCTRQAPLEEPREALLTATSQSRWAEASLQVLLRAALRLASAYRLQRAGPALRQAAELGNRCQGSSPCWPRAIPLLDLECITPTQLPRTGDRACWHCCNSCVLPAARSTRSSPRCSCWWHASLLDTDVRACSTAQAACTTGWAAPSALECLSRPLAPPRQ